MSGGRPDGGAAEDMRRLFLDKLRAEVAAVNAKRRKALWTSVVIGLAVFAALFLIVLRMMAPYSGMSETHGGVIWPFYLLLPLTFAVLAFSIAHILTLRSAVNSFRSAVLAHVAEFVDPGLVYEGGRRMAEDAVKASLLFPPDAKRRLGEDHFRGGSPGGSRYELCEYESEAEGGREAGLYFSADLARREGGLVMLLPPGAPASLSGIRRAMDEAGLPPGELVRLETAGGWQAVAPAGRPPGADPVFPGCPALLDSTTRSAGVGARLSFRDGMLRMVVAEPRPGGKDPSYFSDFDFARLLEFCRDVRLCLEILRRAERREE